MSLPRRVLVAGGTGFIGSHIVDRLVGEGFEVGVIDNLATGSVSNINKLVASNKIRFHESDITDYEQVSKIVNGYDAIIHEAALVSVTRSVEHPEITNSVNVSGTVNLLKSAVDSKVQKFIYASSSSVYGDTATLPKNEQMNPSPISPYGVSKLAAENYCNTFARVYGLPTVSLRYFNVYGPRQKYGPYSGVIPIFVKRALKNEPPVINGDGKQTRDFTFVADVVNANLLALKKTVRPGEVYNVCNSSTITINELAQLVLKVVGKTDLVPMHGPERNGDIKASFGDNSKIKKDLGFSPEVSIEEGLRRVLEWFLAGNQSEWD